MNNKTLAFYNKNAKAFAEETAFVDFKETQDKFINILQGKRVGFWLWCRQRFKIFC